MLAAAVLLAPLQDAEIKPPIRDTFIESANPEVSFGRDFLLIGGPNRAILIDHAALRAEVPLGHKITSASLVLHLEAGAPQLASAGMLTEAWVEGTARSLTLFPIEKAWPGATWKEASTGIGWKSDGADGARLIEGASGSQSGGVYTITGLGAALQSMLERPHTYHGIRLVFAQEVRFHSWEAPADVVPRFQIQTAPAESGPDLSVGNITPAEEFGQEWPTAGTAIEWRALISTSSDAPVDGAEVIWRYQGKEIKRENMPVVAADAPAFASVSLPWPSELKSPADHKLSLSIQPSGPDADLANNHTETYLNALPISGDQANEQAVRRVNDHWLRFTRFSFALNGITDRVRISGLSQSEDATALGVLTAALGKPRSDVRDTRDDTALLKTMAVTPFGFENRSMAMEPMPEHKLLGREEAGVLQSWSGKSPAERTPESLAQPGAVLARVFSPSGQAMEQAPYRIRRIGPTGEPGPVSASGTTLKGGGIIFSAAQLTPQAETILLPGQTGLIFEVGQDGQESRSTLSREKLAAEALRGGGTAIIELRAIVPPSSIDRSTNLALRRPVTDSLGRFPAELISLVDGSTLTATPMPAAGEALWLEIDLGRDRLLGEISLVFDGDAWTSFDLTGYMTGQQPSQAHPIMRERQSEARAEKLEDGQIKLTYFGSDRRVRYLRIAPQSKQEVRLAEVTVYGQGS